MHSTLTGDMISKVPSYRLRVDFSLSKVNFLGRGHFVTGFFATGHFATVVMRSHCRGYCNGTGAILILWRGHLNMEIEFTGYHLVSYLNEQLFDLMLFVFVQFFQL